MNDSTGINIEEMKNISKLFLEYRDNINKIFMEYKRIISNSNTYFEGEAGTLYRKRFNELYDKLEIVVNSFTEYSDTINSVINNYKSLDIIASNELNSLKSKTNTIIK